jgi:hypothetical protein
LTISLSLSLSLTLSLPHAHPDTTRTTKRAIPIHTSLSFLLMCVLFAVTIPDLMSEKKNERK